MDKSKDDDSVYIIGETHVVVEKLPNYLDVPNFSIESGGLGYIFMFLAICNTFSDDVPTIFILKKY